MILIIVAHLALVVLGRLGLLLDSCKDRLEEVGVVVTPHVKQHRRHPLQAHTGVDTLSRKLDQAAIRLSLVLHEHVVPDLQHIRVIQVDEMGCIAATDTIVVDLSARAARASLAHLPEVVLHIEGQDPRVRQVLLPDLLGFLIHRHVGLLLVSTVVRRIQSVRVHVVHLRQQLPRPLDRVLFEVVAEGPVAKHLKEGVMVHILANVLKVVVLATSTNALLRVRRSLQLRERMARVNLSNEDGLELVHACIDEEERWVIVRHHWGRWHEDVLLLLEVLDEGVTDLLCRLELTAPRTCLATLGLLGTRGTLAGRGLRRKFLLARGDEGARVARDRLYADAFQVLDTQHPGT
mmetsp:Transcript_100547/g.259697  ORF Transcript_100547/g.259697 Transcript_100547/m.259697 type:complete len:349 (-) Transcript_100547:51-1097(-)